jgi:hypothetical protein
MALLLIRGQQTPRQWAAPDRFGGGARGGEHQLAGRGVASRVAPFQVSRNILQCFGILVRDEQESARSAGWCTPPLFPIL